MIATPRRHARRRVLLRDFAQTDYLRAKPGLRPPSVAEIVSAVNLLEVWAKGPVYCDQLNREFLLDFRDWRLKSRPLPVCPKHGGAMRRARGTDYRCSQRGCRKAAVHVASVSAATANKDMRLLRALWAEAHEKDHNEHPVKRIDKLPEDLDNLEAWTPAEMARIRASCLDQPDEPGVSCRMADLCLALTEVLYDVGSRISAIMNAAPADLDWASGTLTLRAANKKDRKCQVYRLSDQALSTLRRVFDPCSPWLLPWPYDRRQRGWQVLTDRWKQILQRAGLKAGKKDLFHKLRRTTATELTILNKGSLDAARKHLGHSDDSVTQRYVDRRRVDETSDNARSLPRSPIDPAA